MNSITDTIVGLFLLYFLFKGYRKGFLRTLIGPISLVLGCLAGFFYFQNTQNLAISLVISILGPFVIKFVLSLSLRVWHKTINTNEPPSLISRLSGGTLSVLWSGSMLILTLILISISPVNAGWFQKIKDNVTQSKTFTFINTLTGDRIPAGTVDIKKMTTVFQNPDKLKKLESTKEFQTFMNDSKIKDLYSDQEMLQHIQDKDLTQLLSSPKLKSILTDKELLKKFYDLNQEIMKLNAEGENE